MLDIKKKIEKANINFYDVNFSSDVLTSGIDMLNIDSFIKFIKSENINAVFGCKLYDVAEDYLITDEIIEHELGRYRAEEIYNIIIDDIKDYNDQVYDIDFNIPFSYIIACLYEGKYVFVRMCVYRGIDESFLVEPGDKLKEIVLNNEIKIQSKRQENKSIINQLKIELHEIIINDKNFLTCTNKKLRFNYIKDLLTNKLDEHFDPLKNLWLMDSIRGIVQDPIDFVELIWREKNNKNC